MATGTSRVNTGLLREAAQKVRSAQSEAISAYTSIGNVVNSLPDVWTSSEASGAFKEKFDALLAKKENLDANVQKACAGMETIASRVEEDEGRASSLLSRLREISENFSG